MKSLHEKQSNIVNAQNEWDNDANRNKKWLLKSPFKWIKSIKKSEFFNHQIGINIFVRTPKVYGSKTFLPTIFAHSALFVGHVTRCCELSNCSCVWNSLISVFSKMMETTTKTHTIINGAKNICIEMWLSIRYIMSQWAIHRLPCIPIC